MQRFTRTSLIYVVPAVIILAGILFRSIYWQRYSFGFDQVQIMENAEQILRGKLTLIGPRTSAAAMFTGPLIYYLAALWMLLVTTPIVLIGTAQSIALVTAVVLSIYTNRLFGHKQALVSLIVWSLSAYLISLDRTVWNPNFSLLAALLTFFPIIAIQHHKDTKADILAYAVGGFFAYQAHFSGFILIPLSLLLIAIISRNKLLQFLPAGVLGLLLSLLPTFLFDLRHDFLNTKGFLELFTTSQKVTASIPPIVNLYKSFYVSIENIGKFLVFGTKQSHIMTLGIIVTFLTALTAIIKKEATSRIAIIWIAAIAVLFALYKGEKPEYYYIIQFPAIIVLLTQFMSRIHWKIMTGIILVISTSAINYITTIKKPCSSLCLGNQLQAMEYVQKTYPVPAEVSVIYDMKPIETVGLKYLLARYSANTTSNEIHIVYPVEHPEHMTAWIESLGIRELKSTE